MRVATCRSQVALACPRGLCWSRRWWCADWSVLSFPAGQLPGCSRSSSYKRRWKIVPNQTQLKIPLHTSVTSSLPLLREESAAKRGCKHQAGGGDGERCFRRHDWLRDIIIFPVLTTDPRAPLELEHLKLGIAAKARWQRAQPVVKTGATIPRNIFTV